MSAATTDLDWKLHLRRVAMRWLSQREYTRHDLRIKLLWRARRSEAADSVDQESVAAFIESLLDDLRARGWQSDERSAQGIARSKAPRFGDRHLRAQMHRSGLASETIGSVLHGVVGTELDRARALWQRRFGAVAPDAVERARQARYLAGRGFSADIVRQVVRGLEPEDF